MFLGRDKEPPCYCNQDGEDGVQGENWGWTREHRYQNIKRWYRYKKWALIFGWGRYRLSIELKFDSFWCHNGFH